MRKRRLYFVWLKGHRGTTERRVEGLVKANAIWTYANTFGFKTIEVDAVMVRDVRKALAVLEINPRECMT